MAGELAGDDASGGTRQFGVNTGVSSSDRGLGSNSFRRDDTSGVVLSSLVTPFLGAELLVGRAADATFAAEAEAALVAAAGGAVEVEASACVGSLFVRGRFSFLSGSCTGSAGDAVTERVFLLRTPFVPFVPFVVLSAPLTRSNAPHARLSSLVSSIGAAGGCRGGVCNCSLIWDGMLWANVSRAPRRLAIFMRCCQRSSSWRSSCWNRRYCSRSSSSSSWLSRSSSLIS